MRGQEERQRITITMAARKTGMSEGLVRRCVRLELVNAELTADELSDLRRIRRLIELGVNLTGIEIILRMRRRIIDLEAELARGRGEDCKDKQGPD
jgi:pilus assembly protein TadC